MAQKQTAYQKWYKANKDEFNARRRERYQIDADYRRSQLVNARQYRAKRRLSTETRYFFIGDASELVGRSPQTIRAWEKAGLIPRSVNDKGLRIYTSRQVALMVDLDTFMSTHAGGNTPEYKAGLKKLVSRIWDQWE